MPHLLPVNKYIFFVFVSHFFNDNCRYTKPTVAFITFFKMLKKNIVEDKVYLIEEIYK